MTWKGQAYTVQETDERGEVVRSVAISNDVQAVKTAVGIRLNGHRATIRPGLPEWRRQQIEKQFDLGRPS